MAEKHNQEAEVNMVRLIKLFWVGRKTILKVVFAAILAGGFIGLLIPKQYTAITKMVPQVTDPKIKLGGLSSLAALAGFNMNSIGESEITPKIYAQIVSSTPFQLELMNTQLKFRKIEKPVTLFYYLTEIKKQNLFIKYTIGLPGVIIKALKGKNKNIILSSSPDDPLQLTDDQIEIYKILNKLVSVSIDEKEGYVLLKCVLDEPLAAAQLARNTQKLLTKYITEFKIAKAKANLEFIQQRHDDFKKESEDLQNQLSIFRDRNKNFSSAIAKAEEERLNAKYTLVYGVYSDLAKQLEQSKIQVKEDTPVFTIIEPVTVPAEKSRPRYSVVLAIAAFFGLFFGAGIVLWREYSVNLKDEWKTAV